uniref:G-protein coupled receptors family 1 profile domain-containing protein n=1 Tax=Anguilla anguilla TaxID=7936 RepID=A0A0E9X232_ANGAN
MCFSLNTIALTYVLLAYVHTEPENKYICYVHVYIVHMTSIVTLNWLIVVKLFQLKLLRYYFDHFFPHSIVNVNCDWLQSFFFLNIMFKMNQMHSRSFLFHAIFSRRFLK